MSTTTKIPIGILPHIFLLRQFGWAHPGSAFSLKLFSVVSKDAEDESEGSAGIVCADAEFAGAGLPV